MMSVKNADPNMNIIVIVMKNRVGPLSTRINGTKRACDEKSNQMYISRAGKFRVALAKERTYSTPFVSQAT